MSDYNPYSTKTFTEVWDEESKFTADLKASPFKDAIKEETMTKLYYLLYQRYGNSPIANRDENQWKYRIFSVIFQYGSTWEKKLEVQAKLRGLSEDEIMTASKSIHNHANNPSTEPYTADEESLSYIDDQNVSTGKRGKVDAYAMLWDMLRDVTEPFIQKFEKCFKKFVDSEYQILYPEV
jgi:hypothetical protein